MITLDLNTKHRGTTQYTEWDFEAMVRFGNKYVAASSAGLFEIGDEDDMGNPIEAMIEPATTNLGSSNQKRIRYMYFSVETDGKLDVEILADEGVVRTFRLDPDETGQQRIRVPVGRDGQGVYWTWRIKNVDGVDFSVDQVEALTVVRHPGHGR